MLRVVALQLAGSQLAGRVLQEGGADVEVEVVPDETHALLRRPSYWHRRVADFLDDRLGVR
ncbi:hypothetical protein BH23ACT6_BH23ACT6_19140 [soil metagenome]